MIDGREKKVQTTPSASTASAVGPCPTIIKISRTYRHWEVHPAPSLHPTTPNMARHYRALKSAGVAARERLQLRRIFSPVSYCCRTALYDDQLWFSPVRNAFTDHKNIPNLVRVSTQASAKRFQRRRYTRCWPPGRKRVKWDSSVKRVRLQLPGCIGFLPRRTTQLPCLSLGQNNVRSADIKPLTRNQFCTVFGKCDNYECWRYYGQFRWQ